MASLHASSHSKVFKRLRVALIQELPDPRAMLEQGPRLGDISGYERSQILSPATACGRAEKLVDVMELSGNEGLFLAFVGVLRPLKPALARRLEDTLREVEGELPPSRSDSDSNSNRSDDSCQRGKPTVHLIACANLAIHSAIWSIGSQSSCVCAKGLQPTYS